MPSGWRWQRREAKRAARRNRMPKHGRSVFDLERIQNERAIEAARKRKRLREEANQSKETRGSWR